MNACSVFTFVKMVTCVSIAEMQEFQEVSLRCLEQNEWCFHICKTLKLVCPGPVPYSGYDGAGLRPDC